MVPFLFFGRWAGVGDLRHGVSVAVITTNTGVSFPVFGRMRLGRRRPEREREREWD